MSPQLTSAIVWWSSPFSCALSSKLAKISTSRLRHSGLMNLSTSRGQPVVEPNQSTRCGSSLASSGGISKMGDAGDQYSGSIEPGIRVREPLSGESVIVHHFGQSS